MGTEQMVTTCHCNHCHGSTTCNTLSRCFVQTVFNKLTKITTYSNGCLADDVPVDPILRVPFICLGKPHFDPRQHIFTNNTCCTTNLCNVIPDHCLPNPPEIVPEPPHDPGPGLAALVWIIPAAVIILLIIFLAAYIYIFATHYFHHKSRSPSKHKLPFTSSMAKCCAALGLRSKAERDIERCKPKIPEANGGYTSTSSGATSLIASSRNTDSSLMSSVEVPLLNKCPMMNGGDLNKLFNVNNLTPGLLNVDSRQALYNYSQFAFNPNAILVQGGQNVSSPYGGSTSSGSAGFNSDRTYNSSVTTNGTNVTPRTDQTNLLSSSDVYDDSSSSGFGPPLLIQRSIARQIELKEMIGKGRFGEVWRGRWRDENVAVKIFFSLDETSWQREVEIYQTTNLRHENILGFISADNKDKGTFIQLWLITDYYEFGSLYDYLESHTLTVHEMANMALSIASGLCHLHYEIDGLQNKPAIAHRDLKSKNILVKSNKTCAIADLGLAVRQLPHSAGIDLPSSKKVGTRRYLPPEVLSDELTKSGYTFDAFKMGDIYSFGLVLWELANRTAFNVDCDLDSMGHVVPAEEYHLPYFDMVAPDPSIEEMKQIVVVENRRPTSHPDWVKNESMKRMWHIMSECWTCNPTARLSTLRAKKNLANLHSLLAHESGSSGQFL